jgi:hypothetical protein
MPDREDTMPAFGLVATTPAHHQDTWTPVARIGCLVGHADVLIVQRDRLYLRCDQCGRESPGWDVTPRIAWRTH